MRIEQKINYQLNKYPKIKMYIKSIYQHLMYAISVKIKSEGNIEKISPDDNNYECFFGYYDKSPWDISDRYVLCLRAEDTWSDVSPKHKAKILLIDTNKEYTDDNRVREIGETSAWNVQQGCMLQWLGPEYDTKIIYNDFRNNMLCSIILDVFTMEERVLNKAIYSVSNSGKYALTLDFTRLYSLRPGYGYYNLPETACVALPISTCIWKIDLETGEETELLSYTDFANFKPRAEMSGKEVVHKVNHIMLSPNGKRFMVLYRFFKGDRKYTRLITCNVDGTDMYLLSDDDMVSHCFWKNDKEIIAFENKKKSGAGYYLMKDKSTEYTQICPEIQNDGHPSYSPNGNMIVTDSYPNRARISNVMIFDEKGRMNIVARFFSPFKYDNDVRCDLHPRWNRKGDMVCIDSVFEGRRGLYAIQIEKYMINEV